MYNGVQDKMGALFFFVEICSELWVFFSRDMFGAVAVERNTTWVDNQHKYSLFVDIRYT